VNNMDEFTQALETSFGIDRVEEFHADAVYFEEMDCVEYLEKDVKTYAERIDKNLTLSYDRSDVPVGFVLKGFKNYFNNNLRDLYDFTGEDFISLMDVILILCKEKASLYKDVDAGSNGDAIEKAYRQALSMTRKNEPKLSLYSLKEAA